MLSLDRHLGIHPQAAMLRSQRAELIASNLANADTPNYQARDLDFGAVLEQALGNGDGAGLTRTDGRHFDLGEGPAGAEVLYRTPTQASLDQNSVDVQAERARFADNAVRYQATLRFLESKFSGLVAAFRGE